MSKSGPLAIFLALSFRLIAQSSEPVSESIIPPYTLEYATSVSDLLKSFETVEEEIAIIPDTIDPWLKWKTVHNYTFGKNRGSIPMIADLNALHPFFRDKILELIRICKSKGIELAIVESYRTRAKQNEYKSMGRKYTRSGGGRSKHQYGLAVDVVPVVDSVAVWHDVALWRRIGVVGERLGLRWGGRWRHPYDPGHFEWTGGLGSYQLAEGVFPLLPKPLSYPCIEDDIAQLKDFWTEWENEQSSLARKGPAKTGMK